MHTPRGNNDRLNEANTNRNNGNRLFDSQNNAKGGYCLGGAMSYYEGSLLTVEWTNQHGCGQNPEMACNMVIQYMCSTADAPPEALVRDGTTTDTIPNTIEGVTALDDKGKLKYGMNEPLEWYQACQTRSRNMGLYIADRADPKVGNLNGKSATVTRQNNNGGRRGLECPEERDYYPYWVQSPWKDVAILTDKEEYCEFYKSESDNVKAKFVCQTKDGKPAKSITENDCLQADNVWVKQDSYGIPAPDCIKAPWGRDNHLGNSLAGFMANYNWTIFNSDQEPCVKDNNCACVLRLRYNISTGDLGSTGNHPATGFIDWTSNGKNSPVLNRNTAGGIRSQDDLEHQLATDTSQFGRTFQDRSFVFNVLKRPSGIPSAARIYNLNVRGKRGNIVELYPAVEYDFVPSELVARSSDYIHFQWTGCDTNPAGNAGEGIAGTDRSNVVQIANFGDSVPASDDWLSKNPKLFQEKDTRVLMSYLGQTGCKSYAELLAENNNNQNNVETDTENCMKLNAAPAYFDGGLTQIGKTGVYHFMSTRNNNFSNRGQKASINIMSLLPSWAIAVVVVGAFVFLTSGLIAGLVIYARTHPHSGVANVFAKI
jgi:hypothetical protein